MISQINEHNMIGSYSETVMDAAFDAGYEAGRAGADRRAPQFVYVRERRVNLTGFTRTQWFSGYDQAVRDTDNNAEINQVAFLAEEAQSSEIACVPAEIDAIVEELAYGDSAIAHVENLVRQKAKQLLETAGFTGVGTMYVQEFGLPKVYTCWCDRDTVCRRVPLDQLIPSVQGWIDAERGWQQYRKVRLSIV